MPFSPRWNRLPCDCELPAERRRRYAVLAFWGASLPVQWWRQHRFLRVTWGWRWACAGRVCWRPRASPATSRRASGRRVRGPSPRAEPLSSKGAGRWWSLPALSSQHDKARRTAEGSRLSRAAAKVGTLVCLLSIVTSCGGGDTTTRATGTISTLQPALCVARHAATGVCAPGGDAAGHKIGECVTFTYVGTAGAPHGLRVVGLADPAKHRDDCPPAQR